MSLFGGSGHRILKQSLARVGNIPPALRLLFDCMRDFLAGMASSRAQGLLFSLALLGMIIGSFWFASSWLSRLDLIQVLTWNMDDALYYCQIAKNMAAGKFSTFDGGLSRTNGYHPAWMLVITPVYWVLDPKAALYAIKALEIGLVTGGVALIVVAARWARLPWILMVPVLPLLAQHRSLIVGMEAALTLFSFGLLFAVLCGYARKPDRWKTPLALVAFVLPWIRLESLAISLAATGTLCFFEWRRHPRPASLNFRGFVASFARLDATRPLLGAISGIAAYFAYNRIVFGGIVPVSARVKQMWSQEMWKEGEGWSLAESLRQLLSIEPFNDELLAALEVGCYLAVAWWLASRLRNRENWLFLIFLIGAFSLAAGHVAKFALTVFTMHPFHASHSSWHYVPAYLLMALMIPIRCCVAIHLVRWLLPSRSIVAARIMRLAIILLGMSALLLLGFTNTVKMLEFTNTVKMSRGPADSARTMESGPQTSQSKYHQRPTYRRPPSMSYELMMAKIVNLALPEGSVIGSWDAGTMAYFSRFPVINLDGLVNSYQYLESLKVLDGEAADRHRKFGGRINRLYRDLGVTHFVNRSRMEIDPELLLFEDPKIPRVGTQRPFKIWSIDPPMKSSERLNESTHFMERLSPYFDYQRDGLSVLVEGRMVLAFTADCEEKYRQDEETIFSWASTQRRSSSRSWLLWRNVPKNSVGVCVAALLLPQDATHPIEIRTRRPAASPDD